MSDLCRCADEVRCDMRKEIERLKSELRGAYNQGFSDGFDSKDKTLMGIGTAADIGFNRFMALANSEVKK